MLPRFRGPITPCFSLINQKLRRDHADVGEPGPPSGIPIAKVVRLIFAETFPDDPPEIRDAIHQELSQGIEASPMSANEGMTEEQQHYLQGFVSGADLARSARGLPTFANTLFRNGATPPLALAAPAEDLPSGPEAVHYRAQDRVIAEGKKLCPEEEAKRQKFPLDRWDEVCARADNDQFPKGADVLLTKYFGLFYVALRRIRTCAGSGSPEGS